MAQYRIPKTQNAMSFLYYKLNPDEETIYKLTSTKHPCNPITRFDLIDQWRRFITSAFADFPASTMPCWRGHYDQFGIVMLYMIERAIEIHMGTLQDQWFKNIEYFSATLFNDLIPTGSEDRIFYRAWLSLIGHPDFVHLSVSGSFSEGLNICNLHWLMSAAMTRITENGGL